MSFESKDDEQKEDESPITIYSYGPSGEGSQSQISQEDLSKSRVDKRSQNSRHTIITTEQNKKFELVGTLTQEEINELKQQTTLDIKIQQKQVVLGRGNFGKVRLAKNEQGQFMAIKKINNPTQDILREIQVYNALQEHQIPNVMIPEENIRTVNSKGNETLYQFMPLADFGDGELFRIALMTANLTQHERDLLVSNVSKKIVESFALMHSNGICHLDFKPANLLFDANGNSYISDFGSSLTNVTGDNKYLVPATDLNYWSPEFLYTSQQKSTEALFDLENWRLGMTLLQISYPEINLKNIRRPIAEVFEKMAARNTDVPSLTDLAKQINEQVEELHRKLEAINAPSHMQNIIIGLLTVDPEKRMTAQMASEEMQKISPLNSEGVNNIFVKLLPERQLAEFVLKVRKCNSIEQEVKRVAPNVSEQMKQQQMQLIKFKPYISIIQDAKLTEGDKIVKLREVFNQLSDQRPQLSSHQALITQPRPGIAR